ncbi:MAG: glycosyltransferase family 4 protein [Pyrinomonadaceae bacterium]
MTEQGFPTNAGRLVLSAAMNATTKDRSGDGIKPPRILMVGTHLTKTRGGISTLITEILNSRLSSDLQIRYIESQAEDFGKFGKAVLALKSITRFAWDCLTKQPSLTYIHLGSNASLYRESIFIYVGKILGKRVIGHFHAGDVSLYLPRQRKLAQHFIRNALNSCDELIACSQESARQLRILAASPRITVINNAINTDGFDVTSANTEKTEVEAPTRILFVGAMGKLKGERDLLHAIATASNAGANIKASLLGYGAKSLGNLAAELGISTLIEHIGPVPFAERIQFFLRADIFVLPTYAEAMPISVIEAMAAGLPVISTTVGGIPELITDGVNGILVEAGDVKALTDKILTLCRDKPMRQTLGNNALQSARTDLDMKEYANKLGTRIEALCAD